MSLDLPDLDGALCAEVGHGDRWFPEQGQTGLDAKRVCGRCDVSIACLSYAMANPEVEGIWGGLTDRQRQQLRQGRLRHCACGTPVSEFAKKCVPCASRARERKAA